MRTFIAGILAIFTSVSTTFADNSNTMIVFDASGSMWGQIDGVTKIEIAREAFSNAQNAWDEDSQNVGLIAYGHRRKGDCSDIETLVPITGGGSNIAQHIQSLRPKGKTPLTESIRLAADELRFREAGATVVLFSDGIETCNADPCALAAELEQDGIDFTAHVIGFGLGSDTDRAQLQCIADNTGGTFLEASDAAGLQDALTQVATAPEAVAPQTQDAQTTNIRIYARSIEGTFRPDQLTIRATNMETGKRQILGSMRHAAEVVSGLDVELAFGKWTIEAISEEGDGKIVTMVSADTKQIVVPFKANEASFVLLANGPLRLGVDHEIYLGATKPLQPNATFTVGYFPAGATQRDQIIDWESRFGSVPTGFTNHVLTSPETPGDYEVIVFSGYDVEGAFARFPITFQADAPIRWLGARTGAPGEHLPIRISGDTVSYSTLTLRDKDGESVISGWMSNYFRNPENEKIDGSVFKFKTGPTLILPETPGVYELIYDAKTEEEEISLGTITVGNVILQDDADAVEPPADDTNSIKSNPESGTILAMLVDENGNLMDMQATWRLIQEDGTEVISRQETSGLVRFENIAPGAYRLVTQRDEDWGGVTEGNAEIIVASGKTAEISVSTRTLGTKIGADSAPMGDVLIGKAARAHPDIPEDQRDFVVAYCLSGPCSFDWRDPELSAVPIHTGYALLEPIRWRTGELHLTWFNPKSGAWITINPRQVTSYWNCVEVGTEGWHTTNPQPGADNLCSATEEVADNDIGPMSTLFEEIGGWLANHNRAKIESLRQ